MQKQNLNMEFSSLCECLYNCHTYGSIKTIIYKKFKLTLIDKGMSATQGNQKEPRNIAM